MSGPPATRSLRSTFAGAGQRLSALANGLGGRGADAPVGGALPVAVGLAIQCVASYLTLIIAGRLLGAAAFGGLAALYVLLATVPVGLFLPLEQEIARRRGREREHGDHDPSLVRRVMVFGAVLCLVVVGGTLALWDTAVGLLGDEPQLVLAFCVGLSGYLLFFVSRGVMSGERLLKRYGLQLAVEATFRLAGLGVLAVIGVRSPAAYGWLFGLAPWVAIAATTVGIPAVRRAAASAQPVVGPIAWLLSSSVAAQLLIGAGPLTAQLFAGDHDDGRIGAFLAALVVVRVPVLVFSAVQPSLLPVMAGHVAVGRHEELVVLLRRVLLAMSAFAVLTMILAAAIGPWSLTFLFGHDFVLSWSVFLIMGLSVGVYLVAVVLGQAVLALGQHRRVATGWLAGLVGLAIGVMLADDPVLKANLGLLIGAATVGLIFAVSLWRAVGAETSTGPARAVRPGRRKGRFAVSPEAATEIPRTVRAPR